MKNYVVENYENYREEDRLSTNNARRIEYLTTVRILDELIDSNQKILDPSLPLAKNFFLNQAKKIRNLLDFF